MYLQIGGIILCALGFIIYIIEEYKNYKKKIRKKFFNSKLFINFDV